MRRLEALAALIALVATACGGRKMSADETARWLEKNRVAPGVHVKCVSGSEGWDYDCTLSGPGSRQDRTYGYNVDDHRVTDFSF
jgi:hypothetical protein